MSRLIDADALREIWVCQPGHDFEPSSFVYSIDNAPTVQPASLWRRVDEELPEPHEYVLCCGKKGGCFVGWTLDNADVIKANGHGRAFVHGGNARTFNHWMPLPEPPKNNFENPL